MNLYANPTKEQLQKLLANCNDDAGQHMLWVTRNGEVKMSRIPANEDPFNFQKSCPEMQLRYEAFLPGYEYVGPEAAVDDSWVSELFESLRQDWKVAKGKQDITVNETLLKA